MLLFIASEIKSVNFCTTKSISFGVTTKLYPIGVNTLLIKSFFSISVRFPNNPKKIDDNFAMELYKVSTLIQIQFNLKSNIRSLIILIQI